MPNTSTNHLAEIFSPRSIAFAGIIISDPDHWTRNMLQGLLALKYPGPIYLVNPRGGEVNGLKVYEKFSDIPKNVDYVISTVPARASVGLIKDAALKKAKAVQFCTSGFREIGTEEGIRLENEIAEASRATGVRIIGPNCLGIYNPAARMSFRPEFPPESGPVGYICQSGGNATALIKRIEPRGVRFSKAVSYGNACDLDESDYLEFLAGDPSTRIIAMYIEGIKDGRKLRRALEKAAATKKPVVLLKGGITEEGARAAAGHTASLAGSFTAWEALCRQFNVIRVNSVDEMADVLVTLTFLPEPPGRRVALIGAGGGSSVLVTDEFGKRGLRVPPLPQELQKQILEFTPPQGNILRNPIDYSQSLTGGDGLIKTIRILEKWPEADLIIWFTSMLWNENLLQKRLPFLMKNIVEKAGTMSKKLAMVLEPGNAPEEVRLTTPFISRCAAHGLPTYLSFGSAAYAIDTVLRYQERQRQRG
ncbi:MAG: CoA-binding protein [Dehalococcoidales bacterium]|nr:CoA-binding protein [Dehalococcoidales bacterium]